MAQYQTPTTELEAVNSMLHAIGEAPVSTLESSDPLPVDADVALRILRETNRAVQTRGWHWNTEVDYPLALTVGGDINVPINTLACDTSGQDADVDVVLRGTRLYDREHHTYTFTKSLKVRLVLLLDFEELPEAARAYINMRAARRFQQGVLGSAVLAGYTEADEVMARALVLEAECESADFNALTGNLDALDIVDRRL